MPPDANKGAERTESLDEFLRRIQYRALAIARLATRSTDEALELVQDAMCAFVQAYRDKSPEHRMPLFHRCLNNRIVDWHRKRRRRGRWMLPWYRAEDPAIDGSGEEFMAAPAMAPDRVKGDADFAHALDRALRLLPTRQRQVFLLRAWEELDVAETAMALQISAGSVKTHYSRARHALRAALEAFDE